MPKDALYAAIRDLRVRGGKAEREIITFLAMPEGKDIREMVDAELSKNPTTRGGKRKRTVSDVVRAALKETYGQ